jgi:hypothetical protein
MSFPITWPDSFANGLSINWEEAEDIIRAWVMAGTGYASERVWWADQKIPQGATDFAVIRFGGTIPLGAFDAHSEYTDLGADAGGEIEIRTRGDREVTVGIQIFTAAVVGNECARAKAIRLQALLGLPSIREPMVAAGVSPFDTGQIQNLSGLIGGDYAGRASLDCRFYITETVSDYVGYISEIETDSYLGPPDLGTADGMDI